MSRPLIGHSAELPPSLLGNPNVLDPDGRLPMEMQRRNEESAAGVAP